MPVDEYRNDFSEAELKDFNELLEIADESFVVENLFIMHGVTSRDDYYRSAGYYIAENSYVLLALWDGVPAERKSCGTSKAVWYMLKDVLVNKDLWLKNRMNSSVIHIKCSRQSGPKYFEPELRLLENTEGCQKKLLAEIDKLNKTEMEIADERPEIVPALQRQADWSDWRNRDLLIELYIKKYGDSIIREAQKKIDELERQMIDLKNDTSLDEFEYIDAEYKNEYLEEQCENIRQELFERICREEL